MQPTGGEMPGMAASMATRLNGSPPQIPLQQLHHGHPPAQHHQHHHHHQMQDSSLQEYDHSAAGASHDDFFDQVLSSLPWVDLSPANKSPWDLPPPNGAGVEASPAGQKLFGVPAAREEQPTGAEGLHYAAHYDESVLLASRLRQHQISGGGGGSPGTGKTMGLHLNHAPQQQHMLITGVGRSAAAGDSGLLPLPLSLGSGADSADSGLLADRSRDDVDHSFKSISVSVGDGLYNRFAGPLPRSLPAAAANQQQFHHTQAATAVPSQSFGAGAPGAAPPRQRVRARRGQATDPHSIAERLRRERIAERMKALQELVPNGNKTDKASMLDEIIDYVKFLQLQVKVLSMSRLGGAAAVVPLVADISSEAGGAGRSKAPGDGLAVTEHQVAKLMADDIGSAMQYLQGKGLCLMPISLASAISSTAGHSRAAVAAAALTNGAGVGSFPAMPASNADAPSSPSMSVLTVQSAVANGADADVSRPPAMDAASVSNP